MVTTLRRIEPMSLAKIYAVITGSIMLLVAVPAGCGLAIAGGAVDELGEFGAGVGLVFALLYPVVGAVMGFVAGYLYAAIYNIVSDRFGGVELEFDEPLEAGVTF